MIIRSSTAPLGGDPSSVNVLETDPIPYHGYYVAKLEGAQNAYRVRIGGTRIVYVIDRERSAITIRGSSHEAGRIRVYESPRS